MKSRPRAASAALLFAALVLGASGAAVAYVEARTFIDSGITARERFDVLADGAMSTGFSSASKQLVMRNCYEGLSSIFSRTQPADRRAALAARCLELADDVTASDPANSFAWYIAALAAAGRGDGAVMSERLRMSQLTGPNEQWIAELRVDLGEDHRAYLTAPALAGQDDDLALLVRSQGGISSIARRYVREPEFRERITSIVETLPPKDQERFVGYVTVAAERVTGG